MSLPFSRRGRASSSVLRSTSENSHQLARTQAHSVELAAPSPAAPWASPQAQTFKDSIQRRGSDSELVVLKVRMLCSQDALQRGHLRW